MKKYTIVAIALVASLFIATTALGAPSYSIFRTLLPETNNTYDLGTSTNKWKEVWATTYRGDGSLLTGITGSFTITTINGLS